VFYSTYGHIYKLAQAVAEGAGSVEGVTVKVARFPETLSDEVLTKMHALEAKVLTPSTHACVCVTHACCVAHVYAVM
jgi:NAD(P)H dehydrogenase (quinone)